MHGSRRQRRALQAALADFYGPGLSSGTFVQRAFALTESLVPFSLNSYGVIDRRTGVLNANFDRTPPGLADAFAAFGRHMGKYAAFRFDPSVNGGRPFSARDFYSQTALEDLDIFQEVYRPMRYDDHCFMHVPAGPNEIVFAGFLRDGRPFDDAEKAVFAAVQPHLSHGRRLALAMTAADGTPISPELFERAGFTPRECDVIHWLTQGKSNDEIATILGLRADSVSRHLRSIYEKMGVEHRVAATIHALQTARAIHAEFLTMQGGGTLLTVRPRRPPSSTPPQPET